MKKKYKSEAFEAIHSNAVALYKIKVIDEETMKTYDDTCLKTNQEKKDIQ